METESGAKIAIRGKGSVKEGKGTFFFFFFLFFFSIYPLSFFGLLY